MDRDLSEAPVTGDVAARVSLFLGISNMALVWGCCAQHAMLTYVITALVAVATLASIASGAAALRATSRHTRAGRMAIAGIASSSVALAMVVVGWMVLGRLLTGPLQLIPL